MVSACRHLGILTAGGDCSGLNAVIRAVVLRAGALGWKVSGVCRGLEGLLAMPPRLVPLDRGDVPVFLLQQGGTILGASGATGDPARVAAAMQSLGLDALVMVGGDGSLHTAIALAQAVPLVFVPKTIDNDLAVTGQAVGFATATSVVTEVIDRIQTTAASHQRLMIVQVMGRDAGHIALHAGVAGGADIILIPEIPFSLQALGQKVMQLKDAGQNHVVCVVAESVRTPEGTPSVRQTPGGYIRYEGIGDILARHFEEMTGMDTRVTVPGHQQRGGSPCVSDRILGSAMGVEAVDMLARGQSGRVVVWQEGVLSSVPLDASLCQVRRVDSHDPVLKTARHLGISFGD